MGYIHYAMHKYAEAEVYLQKAIRLTPDNAKAHQILGISLNMLGKYREAIDSLEKSLQIDPRDNATYYSYEYLGDSYFSLGQRNQAMENYNTSKKLAEKMGDLKRAKAIEKHLNKHFKS